MQFYVMELWSQMLRYSLSLFLKSIAEDFSTQDFSFFYVGRMLVELSIVLFLVKIIHTGHIKHLLHYFSTVEGRCSSMCHIERGARTLSMSIFNGPPKDVDMLVFP